MGQGWYCLMMDELRAIVHGRVQLVMFRDFTQRRARRLGITGTVLNLKDGTVEVIAQGEKSALETLLEALRHGSFLSRVDSVESQWRTPEQTFTDFDITY